MPAQEKYSNKMKPRGNKFSIILPIYEIKIVIDNMKTKVLFIEVAKRTRINIQISIKVIVAKTQKRS